MEYAEWMFARMNTRGALALVLVVALAPAAVADTRIEAKVQCQDVYGGTSDLDAACERGVDLASRMPNDLARAMADCDRDQGEAQAACRRGISLQSGLAARARGRARSFSYGWHEGSGAAAQVDVGDYKVRVGDAERAARECMRDFEGSKTPPSCLSGLTVERKAP